MNYLSLFKLPGFIKLFIAHNLINFSQSFAEVTLIWLIYKQTDNPLFIALFGILTRLPAMIFGTLASQLLDSIAVNRALSYLLVIKGIIFTVLFMLPFNNYYILALVVLLLMVNSAINVPISAGINVLISYLFDDEQLITINSVWTISFDIAYIFGSLSTIIISLLKFNQGTFIIVAILFVIASLIFVRFDVQQTIPSNKKENIYRAFLDVRSYLLNNKKLLNIIILTTLWNGIIWGAIPIILPIYTKTVLQGAIGDYGILNAMQSVGIILAAFIIGLYKQKYLFKAIRYLILIQCVCILPLTLLTSLWQACILLVIAGIVSAPIIIYKSTYFQKEIDKFIIGKVFAIISLVSTLSYTLGNVIFATLLKGLGSNYLTYIHMFLVLLLILIMIYQLKFKRRIE